MGIFDWIFQVLIFAFMMYMYLDFVSISYIRKEENQKKIVMEMIMISIFFVVIKLVKIPIINLVGYFLIFFLCGILLFEAHWKQILAFTLMFCIINAGVEVVGEMIMSALLGIHKIPMINNSSMVFLFLFEKILTFCLLKIIQTYVLSKEKKFDIKFLGGYLLLPLSTCFIFEMVFESQINIEMAESQKITFGIGCFLLLFVNAYVFALFEKLSEISEYNRKIDLLNLKFDMEKHHYESLEESNIEHKRFIHDTTKYMHTIAGLATDENYKEIIGIINHLDKEILQLEKMQYTNHKILNALLIERNAFAKDQSIDMDILVEPNIEIDFIEDIDLISMIGNLIDNAIEAACKCEENDRNIQIKLFMGNEFFLVCRIENYFMEAPLIEKNNYVTTKINKKNHGIGINNVRKIAQKYGGLLEIHINENIFRADLILSIHSTCK